MVAYRAVVITEFLRKLMGVLGLSFECINDPTASVTSSGAHNDVVEETLNAIRGEQQ